MRCAWQEFICLLPVWMRQSVDEYGKEQLQELRLRLNQPPKLVLASGIKTLFRSVNADDLKFVINAASNYSPWTVETMAKGYIAAPGGHRIGIAGESVVHNGNISGIRSPTSLCMRVARDFPGLSANVSHLDRSILIIGRPGSGKTTLLRDLIRRRSESCRGSICVVDERGELFPFPQGISCFSSGANTDILTGFTKPYGLDVALRTMGPSCIALDEISAREDCDALLRAGWSGVHLYATAHAANRKELFTRPVYRPVIQMGLFDSLLILDENKNWVEESLLC